MTREHLDVSDDNWQPWDQKKISARSGRGKAYSTVSCAPANWLTEERNKLAFFFLFKEVWAYFMASITGTCREQKLQQRAAFDFRKCRELEEGPKI